MNRRVTICGILLTSAVFSADGPEDLSLSSIRPEAIRAHVRFLADDLLEGRGTGTRGFDLAAKYIAAQFEMMGLEPGGPDHTFFQPIRFRSVTVVPEETTVKLTRNGVEETLTWGQDYYASGDLSNPNSSIHGQVAYVHYGVTATRFGIDDYQGIDVRGKVVAFLRGAPSTLPVEERAHYSNPETKRDNARAHGAIGVVVLWDEAGEKLLSFASRLRQSGLPTMAWLDERGHPNGLNKGIRSLATLSQAGTKKLFGGGGVPDKAVTLPLLISARTVSRHSEVTSPNVAAILRGADPVLRDEYVVYTAHADHLGIGKPVNGDGIYNGAMDNGLGTAALIEIARAFTHAPKKARRSVIFLAVTAEEKGLLGSNYFVEHPTVPRSQIVANVNMDGLNRLFDFANVVMLGSEHSNLGTIASVAASGMGLEIVPDPQPEQQLFVRSDQYSFVRRGIPALCQFIGTKASDPSLDARKILAEAWTTRYHVPSDDLSRPFNWAAAAKSAGLNFLLGYLICQDDHRPTWNEGDFFGRAFGNIR